MTDPEQTQIEEQLKTEATREELTNEHNNEEANRITNQQLQDEQMLAEEAEAYRLEAEQRSYQTQQESNIVPERPSYFADIIVIAISFVNDGIDALELTGIFGILSWIISIFLSGIAMLIVFFSNGNIKNPRSNSNPINITGKRLTKLAIGSALEAIPFISIFPWSTATACWSVWDKVKAYKDVKRQAEVSEISSNIPEVV